MGFLSEELVWQAEGGGEQERALWIAVKRVPEGWQVWFGDAFYLFVPEGDVFQLRRTILFLRRLSRWYKVPCAFFAYRYRFFVQETFGYLLR